MQRSTPSPLEVVAPARRSARGRWLDWLLAAGWVAGISAALVSVSSYKLTPGSPATALLSQWPADSAIAMDDARPTLVVFAHPRCPCTAATLAELREILAYRSTRVATTVAIERWADDPAGAVRGDRWKEAEAIPGVRVIEDLEGREAERFGATTSGHVVLYAPDGRLLFAGGITPGRGHVGASPQRERLEALLDGRDVDLPPTSAPHPLSRLVAGAVYGCPLQDRP
ncbi:MAG: RedB protein [Myxococcota bacterium]